MNKGKGIDLISEERHRQIVEEGWTAQHDEQFVDGELAHAAICYCMWDLIKDSKFIKAVETIRVWWPWDWEWWKPKDHIRNLVRAGALIAAEIDRINRDAYMQEIEEQAEVGSDNTW